MGASAGAEEVAPGDLPDPTEGMTERQRKFYELQQKLQQSRRANHSAVVAEKKREKVGF